MFNQNRDFLMGVPDDFPRPVLKGCVSGFQPKILLTKYEGIFFELGTTPTQLYSRWEICEDLAIQMKEKCLQTQLKKTTNLSESELLEAFYFKLAETGWGSDSEMRWVMKRTAQLLNWSVPESINI